MIYEKYKEKYKEKGIDQLKSDYTQRFIRVVENMLHKNPQNIKKTFKDEDPVRMGEMKLKMKTSEREGKDLVMKGEVKIKLVTSKSGEKDPVRKGNVKFEQQISKSGEKDPMVGDVISKRAASKREDYEDLVSKGNVMSKVAASREEDDDDLVTKGDVMSKLAASREEDDKDPGYEGNIMVLIAAMTKKLERVEREAVELDKKMLEAAKGHLRSANPSEAIINDDESKKNFDSKYLKLISRDFIAEPKKQFIKLLKNNSNNDKKPEKSHSESIPISIQKRESLRKN